VKTEFLVDFAWWKASRTRRAARRCLGAWDTEWALARRLRVPRAAVLDPTIIAASATKADLQQLLNHLENYPSLAT
jgi:hypothetical protein